MSYVPRTACLNLKRCIKDLCLINDSNKNKHEFSEKLNFLKVITFMFLKQNDYINLF